MSQAEVFERQTTVQKRVRIKQGDREEECEAKSSFQKGVEANVHWQQQLNIHFSPSSLLTSESGCSQINCAEDVKAVPKTSFWQTTQKPLLMEEISVLRTSQGPHPSLTLTRLQLLNRLENQGRASLQSLIHTPSSPHVRFCIARG